MIACVTIEGVLANGDDLRNAAPTKWGRALYEGLVLNFRTIGFTRAEPDIAQWWLKNESITGWAAVMTKEDYLEYDDWKVRQIEDFLAEGWEVGMIIDPSPEVCSRVTELGVLSLCVSYPTMKIGWRPHEASPRPWSEVTGTVGGIA